jgi:MFS family permease
LFDMELLLAARVVPRSGARGLPKSQRLALIAISAGFLMITLDATIVNVALGAIGADLGSAPSIAQWVVDGYTAGFASLLLLAGSLADGIGVRRGFVVGLAVFVLSSAACALADSVLLLIAARVAQGIIGLASGAAGATLVALNGRHGSLGMLLVCTVPIGFTALAMPAVTGLAMTSAPKLGLGLAAGVFNTARQAGGALGVAVLGAVLTAGTGTSFRPVFVLTACAYGLAVALAAVGSRRPHLSVGLRQPR